jgi:2,5-diketo-D-gluconate reductase A
VSVTVALAPTIGLDRGAAIPSIGLGTWPMVGDDATAVVAHAIQLGYRSIDTAEKYGNEKAVGAGLRASGVPREALFVTSKFNAEWHGVDLAQQAFRASAERLGVDYIDLLLVHWPNPWQNRYVDAWKGLIKLREEGSVRAIGTSNFKPAHIDRLLAATGVAPEINQIQLDPTLARIDTRAYHAAHGIVTAAWSPLGRGGAVLDNPMIIELANRYGKSPGQIVLRWHMELGIAATPRSSNPVRLAQNIDIFDFGLTPDEVASISGLDQGEAAARDSDREGH